MIVPPQASQAAVQGQFVQYTNVTLPGDGQQVWQGRFILWAMQPMGPAAMWSIECLDRHGNRSDALEFDYDQQGGATVSGFKYMLTGGPVECGDVFVRFRFRRKAGAQPNHPQDPNDYYRIRAQWPWPASGTPASCEVRVRIGEYTAAPQPQPTTPAEPSYYGTPEQSPYYYGQPEPALPPATTPRPGGGQTHAPGPIYLDQVVPPGPPEIAVPLGASGIAEPVSQEEVDCDCNGVMSLSDGGRLDSAVGTVSRGKAEAIKQRLLVSPLDTSRTVKFLRFGDMPMPPTGRITIDPDTNAPMPNPEYPLDSSIVMKRLGTVNNSIYLSPGPWAGFLDDEWVNLTCGFVVQMRCDDATCEPFPVPHGRPDSETPSVYYQWVAPAEPGTYRPGTYLSDPPAHGFDNHVVGYRNNVTVDNGIRFMWICDSPGPILDSGGGLWQALFGDLKMTTYDPTPPKYIRGGRHGGHFLNWNPLRNFFSRSHVYWYRGAFSVKCKVGGRTGEVGATHVFRHGWAMVTQIIVTTRWRVIPWEVNGKKGQLIYKPPLVPPGQWDYTFYQERVREVHIGRRERASRLISGEFVPDWKPGEGIPQRQAVQADLPCAYLSEREMETGWIAVLARCHRVDTPGETVSAIIESQKSAAKAIKDDVESDYSDIVKDQYFPNTPAQPRSGMPGDSSPMPRGADSGSGIIPSP
ncbi:MAG: hypothetical protein IPK87_10585 [Planctomycetes bacterium]|nr:hypothetical protein [Planctomycetota bacterium]